MQVTVPDDLTDYVEHQAAERGLARPDEFVRQLIEADRKERESLSRFASSSRAEQLVPEGLANGEPAPMTAESWQEIRDEIQRRNHRESRLKH